LYMRVMRSNSSNQNGFMALRHTTAVTLRPPNSARKHGTTVDEVVTRELEDVACAHAEELAGMLPGMRVGMEWPLDRADGA